jgi:uncharacterized protein involved in outer membrane biogenesis
MVNLRDSLNNYRGRTMSRRRTIVVGTTLLILIPILIISLVLAQFDPNRFAPEIAAAVDKATGRHLVFGSPLRMQVFSLTPQISVENVSLSNPPGFSTPYLLTVTRVEARVGLLPLLAHRLNILSLHLVEPSVTLERGPEGSANWDFTPRLSASSGQAGVIATGGHGYEVALKSVDVENGRVTIEAGQHGPLVINLPNVTGTAASLTGSGCNGQRHRLSSERHARPGGQSFGNRCVALARRSRRTDGGRASACAGQHRATTRRHRL